MFVDDVQTVADTVTSDCICLSLTALQYVHLLSDTVG